MIPTSEPKSPFDRSLVAYALASGAVASSASGAIVYSGVQNLSLAAGAGAANSLAIDVNGGGTDFTLTFLAHDGSNPGRLDITSSASAASLATGASKNIAAALSAGDAISSSPAPNQWGAASQQKLMTQFDQTTGAALAGDWGNVSNRYIGGRIETTPGSNQFNYGWIRISTPSSDAGSVVVHDWAYETTVGQSILAGQTSSIPGGGAIALFSLGAAGLGRWRQRKQA
jgi:hypothetical protein